MNIKDLTHLEVVSEQQSIKGGVQFPFFNAAFATSDATSLGPFTQTNTNAEINTIGGLGSNSRSEAAGVSSSFPFPI